MPSFNLIDEPWIPYLQFDGRKHLGGIRELLLNAPAIREIADASPLTTAALHRLLLAVLHRCFGPEDEAAWSDLWNAGAFDSGPLSQYLDRWHSRFDLFHPTHPFYQNADLDPSYASSVAKLPLSAGKREPFFEHFVADPNFRLSVPEAARELVALHAFAVGGLLSYERHLDPRLYKSAKGGPLAKGAVALIKGDTLFQTLMLNLIRYSPADEAPFPTQGEDAPAWERDEPTRAEDRTPTGYLDLLTWQSRRARLLPERADDGVTWVVRRVVVMKGNQFPDSWPTHERETMVAFQMRRDATPDQPAWLPIGFQRDRALWRDCLPLLHAFSDRHRPPKTVSWLADLVVMGSLDRAALYRMDLAGLNTDQALVHFWRYERLPLPLAYLKNALLLDALRNALTLAETVAAVLRRAASALATLLLSPLSSNGSTGRKPDPADIAKLADHLAPERSYWPRLETPFKRFLIDRAKEVITPSADDTAASPALTTWAEEVKRAALAAFVETAGAAGTSARALKAVASTEGWFRWEVDQRMLKAMNPHMEVSNGTNR